MPGKPRGVKSTAPSPSPARETRGGTRASARSRKGKEVVVEEEQEEEEEEVEGEAQEEAAPEVDGSSGTAVEPEIEEEDEQAPVPVDEEEQREDGEGADDAAGPSSAAEGSGAKKTMEDRMAKLKELRMKMSASSAANRKDLVADHQKSKVTAKELARLEKQRKLAQTLRLKAEAEQSGEDVERRKNWEWSIEQNERWEKKMEEQQERSDTHFHNAEDAAHKLYNRNIRSTKADIVAYERQKEAAMGLAPGTLVPAGATSSSLLAGSSAASGSRNPALSAQEDFYRGADTLAYGDNKPSEEALDRVIGKINKDLGKEKKKRKPDDDEGEVNYINKSNKHFNKKVARYFDKYTTEIRANFERGTAL